MMIQDVEEMANKTPHTAPNYEQIYDDYRENTNDSFPEIGEKYSNMILCLEEYIAEVSRCDFIAGYKHAMQTLTNDQKGDTI